MPFTFAHPAVVLPLRNLSSRWFSGIALIAGSITPDFEYFLRMRIHSSCSHSPEGILAFNLPVGIILILLYLFIVQKPLLAALPPFLNRRIPEISTEKNFLLKRIPVFLISLILGIGSHLLWDAFAHHHGYFTEQIKWLQETQSVAGIEAKGYKIVQHTSTFIGLLFMGIYFIKLPLAHSHERRWSFQFFGIASVSAVLVVILRFAIDPDLLLIGHLIATGISAVLIGILLASIVAKFLRN